MDIIKGDNYEMGKIKGEKMNVLFNDALDTFYLW